MTMVLKSFPRGGKKPEVKSSHMLFDEKKLKKKHKSQIKKKTDDIVEISSTAERLSNATICEGMVILGRISEISEYNLIVSIPGGLLGRIEITNLSESYTNLLQNIIDTKSIQSNEFKPLPDLYNLSDYVVCYVKNINLKEQWSYNLSLEPQLINQNVHNSYLVKDAKMVCTVKSVEDHGYVVDTGITNIRAFVPNENVDKGKQYFPGNQLFCTIKEIKTTDHTSVITLSAKRKKSDSVSRHEIVSLDALTPGTKLTLCIRKVLSNGLQVTFGRNHIGYINQIYLDNPLSAYTDNMEVTGTLLYILPTIKLAYFSLLTDISEKEKLKAGDIIKKAKVLYRESNGIIFKLSKFGLRGFVSLRRTDVPFAKIPTKFEQNSTHKCRVLSYNWMEHIYVCTMEQEILKQKYFSISDLNFGDILTVTVTSIDTNYSCVHVQAGKIKGIVLKEHISDSGLNTLSKLKAGDDIEARVLDINLDKFQKVKFTLKQSLIKSKLPVLYDIHEAQCGSKYHGIIVKMNKNGLLIKFYGDVKGWVPRKSFDSYTYDMNWNYSTGQTVTVCIESVEKNKGKIKLKIVTNEEKEKSVDFSIGELVEGTITESSIEGVYLSLCKEDKEHAVTAFLPASHMAPCIGIGSLLASKSNPEDMISAFVFAAKPSLILSRTFVTQEQYRSFDSLKIGDCIPCTIRDISQDGVRVILPIENYSKFGFVPYKNISNFELLHVNQILFVKITAINTREKQLTLTMTLKDVWESSSEYEVKIMSAVDLLHLYLSKLSELANNTFYETKPISLATLGQKVTGTVEKITKHGLVVQLDNQLMGTVRKDHYSGKIKIGDKVSGIILWKNYIHELVDVSLLPRIVNGISSKQKTLPQLPTEVVLRAEILMITNWFILVLIKRNGSGYLAALPVRRHVNDISPDLTPYVVHDKIRLYVVMTGNESNIVPICMLKSALEIPKRAAVQESTSASEKLKRKEKSDASLKYPAPKRLKTESHEESAANEGGIADEKELSEIKTNNVTNKNKKIEKKLNEKFCEVKSKDDAKRKRSEKENETCENQDTVIEEENRIKDIDENSELDEGSSDESEIEEQLTENKLHIPECGFSWEDKTNPTVSANVETSSDNEEKSEEEPKRKKKKLSAAERREQERQKEREIRQREEALANNQMPNSIDQFDRLVLSSPDSSLVWLQYMAYHLQGTEIDKARAVARRAIKTINFREETERLNVWNAWLNLESRFGTPESLNDVFQEAVRTNDALKVYTHMLSVHVDASRQTELQKLIGTMTSKFKQEPQMWIDCGAALLKIGLKEKSRHIMQRAIQSLPASQHVNLIVRFANLENKLGDKERAQTLFEQILSSYPKRVDVWSCYVDCLIKSEDIDKARKVLERACVQTLPARKMKALFNKFKDFEEKYGTPEAVAHVIQMAADYVEKQCNKE